MSTCICGVDAFIAHICSAGGGVATHFCGVGSVHSSSLQLKILLSNSAAAISGIVEGSGGGAFGTWYGVAPNKYGGNSADCGVGPSSDVASCVAVAFPPDLGVVDVCGLQ